MMATHTGSGGDEKVPSPEEQRAIVAQLDERYLINTLVELAQVPTDVPLGPVVFMEPDDAKLVHYVQHVLRPKFHALGAYDRVDVRPCHSLGL
jgi:hypothetical protein